MACSFCILAFFCSALLASGKTESELKDLKLGEGIPWLTQIQNNQELLDKQNVIRLLYKLFKWDDEIVPEEPGEMIEVVEEKKKERRESPPVRRAGCRIFFWKSWTAC